MTPTLAERLDGRLNLTGPFGGLSDLDRDARLAIAGVDAFGRAEVERRERAWRRLFG